MRPSDDIEDVATGRLRSPPKRREVALDENAGPAHLRCPPFAIDRIVSPEPRALVFVTLRDPTVLVVRDASASTIVVLTVAARAAVGG